MANNIFKLYSPMKVGFLIPLFLVLFFPKINGQIPDKEVIKLVINQLFEGMNKCDSSKVRQVFGQNASLNSIGFSDKKQQNFFVADNRIKSFLEAIAKPKTELWNEKALSYDIKIDGSMAQAWVPYTFHFGDKFSHCGVDNFVFFKENNTWKIIYLVDTMRKDNCIK
jgi:hypothetical protein